MRRFGNPVGLARRWRAAAAAVTEHGLEVVKTRDVAAFGRSAGLELLHGVIGSSADSISKLLRSVHGCLSTLQLTTAENRRLIARERPRDIQQGFEAGSRVLKLTFLDALGGERAAIGSERFCIGGAANGRRSGGARGRRCGGGRGRGTRGAAVVHVVMDRKRVALPLLGSHEVGR